MKKVARFVGILLCLVLVFTQILDMNAFAAGSIDVSTAASGYVTVYYSDTTERMKVGITHNGSTRYSDYTVGTYGTYSLSDGSGYYVVELYENVGGTSYKRVASADCTVPEPEKPAEEPASTETTETAPATTQETSTTTSTSTTENTPAPAKTETKVTGTIDTSNASKGYFTVNCTNTTERMKVGVTFNGNTKYSDYTPGSVGTFSFLEGNGHYALTLYVNVGGTSYKTVASAEVDVTLESENTQYLVSTSETSFQSEGIVAQTAREICSGKTTDEQKAVAIYQYMLSFSYDYNLADRITRGEVVGYTPDTASVLAARKGICYDLAALYAAMCRSQGIPCQLVKGTYKNGSHAWNLVLCNGSWYQIDMTYAVQSKASASTIAGCVTPLSGYSTGASADESKALSDVAAQEEKEAKAASYFEYVSNWVANNNMEVKSGSNENTETVTSTAAAVRTVSVFGRRCAH